MANEKDNKQNFLATLSSTLLAKRQPIDVADAKREEIEQLFTVNDQVAPLEQANPNPELERLVSVRNPVQEPELESLVSVRNPVHDQELESLVSIRNPVQDPELESLVSVRNPDQDQELDDLLTVSDPKEPEARFESLFTVEDPHKPKAKADVDDKKDTDELFRVLGGGPTLTMTRKQKGSSASGGPAGPQERNFESEQLSKEEMNAYREVFSSDPPYEVLTKIILHQNAKAGSHLEGKRANFNHRLNSIIPALQFAVQGAREEYRQAKASGKATDLDLQRLETFEQIQDMFISLKALSKNKSRYEKEHYEARLAELKEQLDKQKIDDITQEKLVDALNEVIENNLFHKRKFYQSSGMGSTPFTAQGETFKLDDKYKKRVKIEHTDNGKTVSAIFSHSRSKLLGERSHKIWKTQGGEYKEFRAQVRDFINVSISEHKKGTEGNPFNIRYIGPPQPEAALAALFEIKKRAYQEGRVLYVLDRQGQKLEIQPTSTFSDAERKYFMSFALENPKYSKGGKLKETKTCAGYKLFKNAIEMKKPEGEQDVSEAMDKFLAHELDGLHQKMGKKLGNVGSELKEVAQNEAWKDNATKQPGKFRA